MTQDELSVVVSILEKQFPGSVESIEMIAQYIGWRNAGIDHKEAMTRIADISGKISTLQSREKFTGIERRNAE